MISEFTRIQAQLLNDCALSANDSPILFTLSHLTHLKKDLYLFMAHFVIAGRSADPEFAKAEMLGYHLQKNLPDFHIEIVMKKDTEWYNFVVETHASKGWGDRMAFDRTIKDSSDLYQMIYRPSGELIGDTKAFIAYVKHAYKLEMDFDKDLLYEIALENKLL
jgi:hypothetical protein